MSCMPVISNVFRTKKVFIYSFLSESFQNLLIFPVYFTIHVLKNGFCPEIQNNLQEKQRRKHTEEVLNAFNTMPFGLGNQRSLLVTILCSWNKNKFQSFRSQVKADLLFFWLASPSFHLFSPTSLFICVQSSVKILPLQISGIFCFVSPSRQLHVHFCTCRYSCTYYTSKSKVRPNWFLWDNYTRWWFSSYYMHCMSGAPRSLPMSWQYPQAWNPPSIGADSCQCR